MSGFDRRTFLKGLTLGGGAFVLAPILRQLGAHAQGEMPPKRLVIMVEGDCLNSRRFTPPEVLVELDRLRQEQGLRGETEPYWGHYVNEAPLDIVAPTLQPGFAPLAPHADDLILVQGLSNRAAGGVSSHSADYGALGCAKSLRNAPGGPTIDTVLAARLGQERAFSRLALGSVEFKKNTDGSVRTQDISYSTSAYGPNNPAPIYVNPDTVHRMLFGTVSTADAREDVEFRAALMDAVQEDVTRARGRLAGPEREKLDYYMGSLESLRTRQSKLVDMEAALTAGMPPVSDIYTSPHLLVRLEAQAELAAAALTIGMTDIVLLASACGNRNFSARYTSIHEEINAKHHFGHGGSFNGMSNGYWLSEIHRRHSVVLSGLIDQLKAAPEGDGTMWDNTIVVYTSDGGAKHHANFNDWPTVVLAGRNANIRRSPGGRSLVYPRNGADNHRHMSNFWNTIAHAMGAPIDDFGEEGSLRVAEGPLPELLV